MDRKDCVFKDVYQVKVNDTENFVETTTKHAKLLWRTTV